MRALTRWLILVACVLLSFAAWAQMPAGHPPVTGSAKPAAASASGSASASARALPPGHPPSGNPQPGGRARSPDMGFRPPQDAAQPMKGLAPGSILVQLRNAQSQPIGNLPVKLSILRATVAEGESRSTKSARSDADGKVTFDGLQTSTRFSYRVRVDKGPASFASPPFQLDREHGHRVILHVYEVTRQPKQGMGAAAYTFVDTRDDVFQVEMGVQVINLTAEAWVPEDVSFQLPEKFEAFKAEEGDMDTRFEADEAGVVRMHGTFTPGTHQTAFRFQVPNSRRKSTQELRLQLPPRVGQLTVIAAAHQDMKLSVTGEDTKSNSIDFPPAKDTKLRGGADALQPSVTRRIPQEPIKSVTLTLSGIPTRGGGAFIATALALLIAVGGGLLLTQTANQGVTAADAGQAQRVLLQELVELERAFKSQRIGPRTYSQARAALLAALTRILKRQHPSDPRQTAR